MLNISNRIRPAAVLFLLTSIQQAFAAAPPIAPTFFGIDQNSIRAPWPPTTAAGTPAPAAALRLWDDGVKWTNLEPCDPTGVAGIAPTDPGNSCYSWANLDTWVRSKGPSAGMDVLYTLGGTPGWATSQTAPRTACETAGIYSCLAPVDVDKSPSSGLGDGTDTTWINFITALATRYKGQIQFYELWNEPDSPNFFAGTNAQFIRMMNDAAAIIRSIDPAARLVCPSFHGPTAATWFAAFLTAGGAADFDIVNFHGRGSGVSNNQPEVILTTYAAAQAVIVAHGLSNLPFWDDEAGWLQNQVLDPDMQAAYVARSYILRASLGLARFYWYQWDSQAPYGLQGTIGGNAFAQVAHWLVGSTVSACTKSGAVYSCPLTLPGGNQGLILWDASQSCADGVCTTAAATVNPEYQQVLDLNGKPVAIQNNSLPLGAKPILLQTTSARYVLNLSPSPSAGGTVTPATGNFYDPLTVVNVTASSNPGYVFTGWTGSSDIASPSSPNTTVTMNGPQTLTANFAGSNLSPAITAVTNAASNLAGAIAPGEIVTIHGSGLGPAVLDQSVQGVDGTAVTFNGNPAPVIYTSANQVAAIVPYATTAANVDVVVSYQGRTSAAFSVANAPAAPGIFTADSTGQGQAAALNQDGSFNSESNPAHSGDAVVLFATGAGQTTPAGVDGALATPPYPKALQQVRVAVGGQQATVEYAGAAPGEVAGYLQINIRIPATVPQSSAVPVVIQIGTARSQPGVTIAIQ